MIKYDKWWIKNSPSGVCNLGGCIIQAKHFQITASNLVILVTLCRGWRRYDIKICLVVCLHVLTGCLQLPVAYSMITLSQRCYLLALQQRFPLCASIKLGVCWNTKLSLFRMNCPLFACNCEGGAGEGGPGRPRRGHKNEGRALGSVTPPYLAWERKAAEGTDTF